MSKPFDTKENLQAWLDSNESEDMRDKNFSYLFEISLTDITECPYWIDEYSRNDNIFVQHIDGYWEPRHYGDIIEERYIYIDTQLLSEEMEWQAEDGGLAYEYRGQSFLRILYRIDTDTDIRTQLIELPNYQEIERTVNRLHGITMGTWIDQTINKLEIKS